ncbi:MAG TPA: hypothetical protein PLO93_00260 [Candidatus Omnitrophota bacterium]|mgnify:CR=1 FL=1|nr:hypothetical protein [Candidatus Omnitrophota bacterium]
MIKKFLCLALVILVVSASPLFAQEKRAIMLKDGTNIVAEILSFNNGIYTLATSFGRIDIPDTDIVSISSASATASSLPLTATQPTSPSGFPISSQINNIQGQLMQDPDFVSKAQDLSRNPEVMQVLSQPDIAAAIMNHDINALQNNPKIKELLSNPQVLDLIQSTGQKLQMGQ